MPRPNLNSRLSLTLGEKGSRVRTNRIKALAGGGVLIVASMFAGLMVGSASNADQISPEAQVASQAAAQVDRLTDHQLAGQRVIATFNGTLVPRGIKRAIRRGRLGGVVLFAGNVPTRAAARAVTRQLQRIRRPSGLSRYPLPIMIDREGGLVKRLAGAPTASAKTMGRRGPGFSRTQGKRTGKNLKNAGVNIDLAPVLDVARPGGEIADTDRGFGRTARRVSATAIPFAKGLQAKGIAATAKHFPGLGTVSLNTDDAVQKVKSSKRVLRRVDEAPYKPFIRADGQLVMVGTAIYTVFGNRPAAFNRSIVTGELRNRLGFEGVTVTDALETVAGRAFGDSKRVAVAGAVAGMDLLLYTRVKESSKAEGALAKRLRSGGLKRSEFESSVQRILTIRAGFPG
ncbi:MAG: beta-N-acetylhexosaminidase [Solirubrobacterales bacterium]|nr:beta-N-acetylhexosaminidase [Solirubrobacterales bacterium]